VSFLFPDGISLSTAQSFEAQIERNPARQDAHICRPVQAAQDIPITNALQQTVALDAFAERAFLPRTPFTTIEEIGFCGSSGAVKRGIFSAHWR
jgi:hypothetical protein